MRILWFTWKDLKHPEKGGAELVTAEITKRLVQDGHQVKIITAGYPASQKSIKFTPSNDSGSKVKGQKFDTQNGAEVIRVGNKFTVYWQAYRYYKKNLRDWPNIVIEEVNTVPFFTRFYSKKGAKHYLFFHQLAREIWFYQMPWFIGWIGYLAEALYLRLLSHPLRKGGQSLSLPLVAESEVGKDENFGGFLSKSDSPQVITISNSTKQDLMKYGFKKENISIISEGVHIEPVEDLAKIKKYDKPTMLSLGAVRKMKRTIHQLKAFEIAKKEIPDLQFKISGLINDKYGEKFLKLIEKSPYKKDIEFMGRVSDEKKEELMQRSHLITVTSLKEGWGLIVTEANSQGTPAVVYDVDGLRDAVKHDETGLVCQPSPANLAKSIAQLLQDKEKYDKLRTNAWKWSKEITFEKCYGEFREIIE